MVQRVDSVSEGIANYGGKIVAVESDLKRLGTENTTTEIHAFKNNMWALQRQLSAVEERVRGDQAKLSQLLDGNTATLRFVNATLHSYGSIIEGLQDDTVRLQRELQQQVKLQNQALGSIGSLNLTQGQQRGLVAALHRSLDDTSQAVQKVRYDFQSLEQVTRQTGADTDWLRSKVENLQVLAGNASALAKANSDGLEEVGAQLTSMSNQLQNASSLADAHDQTLREIVEQQRDFSNLTSSRFDRLEVRLDGSEQNMGRVTGNISFTTQLLGAINLNLNDLRTCSETVGRHSDFLVNLNSSVADVRTDSASLKSQQEDLAARLDKEVTNLSIVMEEMKLVDTKHSQLITNFTILQGERGTRPNAEHAEHVFTLLCVVFQAPRVPEGPEVTKDLRDFPASPARRERRGRRGLRGYEDPEESRVFQGPQVCQG